MKADQFGKAEDSYFLLKQEMDAGRITRGQFDAAMRQSMVKDSQGHYWRLGGSDGKWYRHDGVLWTAADPYATASPSQAYQVVTTLFRLALGGFGFLFLLAVCLGAFTLTQKAFKGAVENTSQLLGQVLPPSTGGQGLSARGAGTPDSRGTASSPTSLSGGPTSPAAQSTSGIPTVTPLSGQPTFGIPTVTPLGPTTPTSGPSGIPPATAIPVDAPAAAAGQGIYVTGMQVLPAQPKRKQPVTFSVAFQNNTGAAQSYRWLVQIYDANNMKGFGNTPALSITVPPGSSQFVSSSNWHVSGPGGCISLVAQPQYQVDRDSRIGFTAPDGGPVSIAFSVCP